MRLRPCRLIPFLVVSSVLLGPGPLAAQLTFGFRAGANYATLSGDGEVDGRTGLHIGGFAMLALSPTLDMQIGAVAAQKGARRSEEDESSRFALDYVEVPILVRVEIPTPGPVSPHVSVGPAVSFEVRCEAEVSVQGLTATVGCGDAGIDTELVDFGAVAGAGVGLARSAPVNLSLDVLYNLGLRSIIETGGTDVKNRAWSLLVSVGFPM